MANGHESATADPCRDELCSSAHFPVSVQAWLGRRMPSEMLSRQLSSQLAQTCPYSDAPLDRSLINLKSKRSITSNCIQHFCWLAGAEQYCAPTIACLRVRQSRVALRPMPWWVRSDARFGFLLCGSVRRFDFGGNAFGRIHAVCGRPNRRRVLLLPVTFSI